ncbi:MAG: MFS transporter [Acidobacteria bacterium]|nr:MFS transporter [Acidobacteriota bacterium]
MSFLDRLGEIRTGFDRPFWVANFTELFERLSYYGTTAVLAIYLSEQLHFSKELTGWMIGTYGFVVWFLPVLGGTLADRFGFRRALIFAYVVMSVGYFLLGSLAAPWMQAARTALSDKWLVFGILMIPALGPSVVKPCVAGTTARASRENVRAVGFSIYYTIVNIGATLGPVVAWLVRKKLDLGMENVFRVSALSVFLMFLFTFFFYRDPAQAGEEKVASVAAALKNMFVVLRNFRFILFLLIFSSFFVVFWQEFVGGPLFIRGYVDPNADFDLLLSVDPLAVICLQIPISFLTRRMKAFSAMTLGLLITSLGWPILAIFPTVWGFIAALIVVAIGEMVQVSRYYDYISRLAPSGQQGLYMGYALLPVAIGYFVAGPLGGHLLKYFGDVLKRPELMWWAVAAIGIAGTLLMVIYDRIFKPGEAGGEGKAA